MTKKIKVIQGGQGAGKNVAIAILLFEQAHNGSKDLTTIMTDTYDNLKDGAIKDFKFIFDEVGLDFEKYYNKNERELKYNGATIQFRHISDSRKTSGKSKRRDKLYINEANKVGWNTAQTYIGRTHGDVYLDYNPDHEFWAHTEIPKLIDENGQPLSEQIILTYKDNECIPQAELDFIQSRRHLKEWFRVYGEGQTGFYSERQIYRYDFADVPKDAKRIPSGMDFGLSPDPTILINVYKKGSDLFLDEVFCENNLMYEKIQGAERMSIVDKMEEVKFMRGWRIVGDSANATALRDLKKHGYNIIGVKKKPNSVIEGIKKVRSYNIYITPRSENLKKGIESWFFKIDQNGKIIPEPDGHEPDGLAAVRYVLMMQDRSRAY